VLDEMQNDCTVLRGGLRRMGSRISNLSNKLEDRKEFLPDDLKNETFESQELFRRAEACIVRGRFEMAEELLLGGARVMPQKLLSAGYTFIHEDLEKFLAEELAVS